jgi:UTP--glucose-1-phosphate uridylyltransferase
VRGHQRVPSDSKEFHELTKRDAQKQLEKEMDNLLKTTDESKRPETQKEFAAFSSLFGRFLQEEGPSVEWDRIEKLPANAVKDYSSLIAPKEDSIKKMLDKLVVVKLNGGLGTSMGCHGPKSVIPVRSDQTFLDMTVQQIEVSLRKCKMQKKKFDLPIFFFLFLSAAIKQSLQCQCSTSAYEFVQHRR